MSKDYAPEALATVHGEFTTYTANGVDVECNAFCRNGLHCDLSWWSNDMTAEQIKLSSQRDLESVIIDRVEPAREAPPHDPSKYIRGTVRPEAPWLVFWRMPSVATGRYG